MPSEDDLQFSSVVKAMDRINSRREAELQKLMQSEDNFELLQQIQDDPEYASEVRALANKSLSMDRKNPD